MRRKNIQTFKFMYTQVKDIYENGVSCVATCQNDYNMKIEDGSQKSKIKCEDGIWTATKNFECTGPCRKPFKEMFKKNLLIIIFFGFLNKVSIFSEILYICPCETG